MYRKLLKDKLPVLNGQKDEKDTQMYTKLNDLISKGYKMKEEIDYIETYSTVKNFMNDYKSKIAIIHFEDEKGNTAQILYDTNKNIYIDGSLKKLERKNNFLESEYISKENALNIASKELGIKKATLKNSPFFENKKIKTGDLENFIINTKNISDAIRIGMPYVGYNAENLFYEMRKSNKDRTYEIYKDLIAQGLYDIKLDEQVPEYIQNFNISIGEYDKKNVKVVTNVYYEVLRNEFKSYISSDINNYRENTKYLPNVGMVAKVLGLEKDTARFIANNGNVNDMTKFLSDYHLVPDGDKYKVYESFMPKNIAKLVFDTLKTTDSFISKSQYKPICNQIYNSKNFTPTEKTQLQEKLIDFCFKGIPELTEIKEQKKEFPVYQLDLIKEMLQKDPKIFKDFMLAQTIEEKYGIENTYIEKEREKMLEKKNLVLGDILSLLQEEPKAIDTLSKAMKMLETNGIEISEKEGQIKFKISFTDKYTKEHKEKELKTNITQKILERINEHIEAIESLKNTIIEQEQEKDRDLSD